ncbi:MAG TPA: PilC/PilY family type IV pilus protein [Oleiagrimonas sp.]|nr:PilC/PilY family type IV pilus protein [Oleiagrimonas sp.]
MHNHKVQWLFALAVALFACNASAQTTYSDNFSGKKANLNWTALDDACLTAGDGSGSIPSCESKEITVGDDEKIPGQGALLLTPAENYETGAILSAFPPFPLSQGIQITFTTYTFGGSGNKDRPDEEEDEDSGKAYNGADGIVFFLTDGTKSAPTHAGGSGGSMGYGCSNGNADASGIQYGYLGLGIDEFGNFLNTGDNGSVGIYNTNNGNNDDYPNTPHGTNGYYDSNNGNIAGGTGPQYQPERIGLRGAGNTNWTWLSDMERDGYSDFYSGSVTYNDGVRRNHDDWEWVATKGNKVQMACRSGRYVTSYETKEDHGITYKVPTGWAEIEHNYDAIPGGYAVLPEDKPIANNSADATRNPTNETQDSDIAWPITYRLTISSSGLLNFAYSYNNGDFQPVLENKNITEDNGPLPVSLRFGFSAGTGGSNNVHEITCFKASPLQANSSAGSNTVTGKVAGSAQFFLASYSEYGWWGSLVADPLIIDSDGDLQIGTQANWDAKCALTGGPCDSMGVDSSGKPTHDVGAAQDPDTRNLFTWTDSGVELSWDKLGSTVQGVLNKDAGGTVDSKGSMRVDWLRGDRSTEQLQDPPGDLRARRYVLGDIINSSPTFVGAPTPEALPDNFYDLLHPSQTMPENDGSATKYSAFVANNETRLNVVYAGSNDGFMHGFEAGAFNSDGSYNGARNDGKEVIGFMPHDVLLDNAVNLASPLYKHGYMVDATPVAGDVFYDGEWHTWLVGGVGSNGQEIYALNITDPSTFSSAAADSLVVGDWNDSDLSHLGNTVGTPIIKRMHNGDWAFIFGSGLHKANDGTVINSTTAGIYIGLIDPDDGSVSFKFLDTGIGSGGVPDGIAYVSSADLDGDAIVDYLYAGDTQGNVWRFNVTSSDVSDWKASTFGNPTTTPLFVAKDADGNRQPITTSMVVLSVGTGNVNRVVLYFGTGQQFFRTSAQGRLYDTGANTFYGIWDWDMDAWNGMSNPKYRYASLSGTQTIARDDLLQQTVAAQTPGSTNEQIKAYRTLSTTNVVCWKGGAGAAGCTDVDEYGWLFDLPDAGPDSGPNAGAGEQIIYSPAYIDGAVVVNTAIPPVISAFQCNPGLQSGWTMAFNPATGGGMETGYFADASGSFHDGDATVGGVKSGGVGTPTVLNTTGMPNSNGQHYLGTQTASGGGLLLPYKDASNANPARVSWRELIN